MAVTQIKNVAGVTKDIHDARIVDSDITNWNSKQDALPTVTNDRYLHTNSSTGSLEWSAVPQYHEVTLEDYLEHEAEYALTNDMYFVSGSSVIDVSTEAR